MIVFMRKISDLFEIWQNDLRDGGLQSGVPTPQLLGPTLKKDYPEIESTARIGWNGIHFIRISK